MNKIHATLLSLTILLCGLTVSAQGRFDDVIIKTTHVAGTVYMLEGAGGNIGVSVGDDGVLMIDDQFAPLADKIRAAISEIGSGDLKFILNTHHHGDHTSGNPVFGSEATIIAHENVRKRLSDKPESGWPVITFESSLSIHFNGEEIKAIHFEQSHTDGDAVIHFTGSNVVHMGDLFFSGRFPFVDLNSGGDVESLAANIEHLMGEIPADAKIIPGHGPLSGMKELKVYHTMLMETIDFVRKGMTAKKSVEDLKTEGLSDKWKSWGDGFISESKWIETVYTSLSR